MRNILIVVLLLLSIKANSQFYTGAGAILLPVSNRLNSGLTFSLGYTFKGHTLNLCNYVSTSLIKLSSVEYNYTVNRENKLRFYGILAVNPFTSLATSTGVNRHQVTKSFSFETGAGLKYYTFEKIAFNISSRILIFKEIKPQFAVCIGVSK